MENIRWNQLCFNKDYIVKYITKWAHQTYSEKCAVCEFYLQTNNNLQKIKRINDIGKEMPTNKVGAVLIWLYMIDTLNIDIAVAHDIDPISIFFHIILGCCENDADNANDIGDILRSIILSPTSSKTSINLYRQFINYYITIYKNGQGCSGENCIYSDTGMVTENMDIEQLSDMRHMISLNWVKRHKKVSACEFYGDDGYKKYQPGIEIYLNNSLSHNIGASESKHFLIKTKSYNNQPNVNDERQIMQKKDSQCKTFIFDIMFILFLCNVFENISINEGTPIYIIDNFIEDCFWCSLCVIPEMRAIINDLVIMGKTKLTEKGIGSDVTQKIPMIMKNNLSHQKTPSSSYPYLDFSYSFARFSITKQVIRDILQEWYNEKYFILKDVLPIDIDKLWKHVSCNTSILCKQNIRRTYIDTDLHSKDEKHMCLITLVLYVTELLERNQCKIKKESMLIQKIGYKHNLSIKSIDDIAHEFALEDP